MNLSITVMTWFLYYAGFYLMQVLLAWYTLGSFRWETLTLATVSFPIYTKAFVNAFTGRDVGWQSTGTAKGHSPYNFIIPQILFFLFLSLTSAVAIWRDMDNGVLTLATAWNITNTLILGAFVWTASREARALRRGKPLSPSPLPEAPVKVAPRTIVARPGAPTPDPIDDDEVALPRRRAARRKEPGAMTWANRFKLLVGIIAVLVIAAAATLLFNQRRTEVASTSGEISAAELAVGTDYGGLVTEAYVSKGDTVAPGDELFLVSSLRLEQDVSTGAVSAADASIQSDGSLLVRAGAEGTVAEVAVGKGSYAAPGTVIATIDQANTLYADLEFVLTPRDFGLVEQGATVDLRLPDERTLTGTVSDMSVETIDGTAHVTMRVDSDALVAEDGGLIQAGTPLNATLHLRDDGPLAGVEDALRDLSERIGLS
ncbi:HlyD family efflux transporter periplasmic adaptor subunit [Demequina litorisediminis]|nr:HlyD family efflux transporter periplasmic adaptor subunit [Demequina litorisediminis]